MSRTNTPELFLPPLAKMAMTEANTKILECYRSFKDHADPAAALTFGLSPEQFEIMRKLSHSDIRWLANEGLPLWKARFELKMTDGRLELDREQAIASLLMTF
jgi:hypothetical protein